MSTTTHDALLATVVSFLDDYAAALASGDVTRVAACYALPAVVIHDDGASIATQRYQLVASFAALARRDPRFWHRGRVPVVHRFESLADDLVEVDVRWHPAGAHDGPMGVQGEPERYVYLLRLVDLGPRIHVAVGPLTGS